MLVMPCGMQFPGVVEDDANKKEGFWKNNAYDNVYY